ncbi:MAG: SDR family oxidoreductase [Alphaproteobacteria bacterium]|nr:SDR family oxidoreductase [Alphaproteobacteria bacterium]
MLGCRARISNLKNWQKSGKEAILKRIPMGHMGASVDIAAAALYLSSEASSYVTGQTLHVNGGMLMVWS